MKLISLAAAFVVALTAVAFAQAASPDAVTVPVGDWLTHIIDNDVLPLVDTALGLLGALLLYELRQHLPAALQAFTSGKNEQLLDNLATEGAALAAAKVDQSLAGRVITVDAPNPQIAVAAQHIIDNAPAALANSGLEQRAVAAAAAKINALAPPAPAVPAAAAQ